MSNIFQEKKCSFNKAKYFIYIQYINTQEIPNQGNYNPRNSPVAKL